MRGVVALVCAAAATVSVAACGVRGQDSPESVPAELRPSLGAAAEVQDQPDDAVVYLIDSGRLVAQELPSASDDAPDALRALLALAGPQGDRRTAIPAGTQLRSVQADGDLIVVGLDERFAQVRGSDQILAVAQVVLTATERPPARRVLIRIADRPVSIPVGDGTPVERPLTREDFAQLMAE